MHLDITTSPQARKRKATDQVDNVQSSNKVAKTAAATALPATPQTNPATPSVSMDSDDEYMSGGGSSQGDFDNMDQDSDGGSMDEGRFSLGYWDQRI